MRELIDDAHQRGLRIVTSDLGARNGEYRHRKQIIVLNSRLSRIQARCTLAHELGHAHYGDDGEQAPISSRQERRATLWAARRLIDPLDYALAERLADARPQDIARELQVTVDLIAAWQAALHDATV